VTNRLEISVCIALLMDVRYRTHDLTKTDASFVLRQTIFSHDVVKQFTAGTVLQHTHTHMMVRFTSGLLHFLIINIQSSLQQCTVTQCI